MNKIIFFCTLSILFIRPSLNSQTLIVSDKADGIAYLRIDKMDGYYNKVQPLEIAIQLKDEELELNDRRTALERYKKSYESEVLEPTAEERIKLEVLFKELIKSCNELNAKLLPDTIRLIVVQGEHYGATTFFTRGHAIATSRKMLQTMPIDNFSDVMNHELFHIISRYHPALREEVYAHVGFNKIEKDIMILDDFYKRILYNPDGVSMDYGIELMMKDSSWRIFVPVIYANTDGYDNSKPAFFSYLGFQLFPLDPVGDVYFMRSPADCADLDMGHIMEQYFERITGNTQYIIHADEILADNFMYLFRSEEENSRLNQELLNKIRNSLTSYEN